MFALPSLIRELRKHSRETLLDSPVFSRVVRIHSTATFKLILVNTGSIVTLRVNTTISKDIIHTSSFDRLSLNALIVSLITLREKISTV